MNSLKKRLISLVLLTCVAFSSIAGCSDKDSKKDSSDDKKSGSNVTDSTDKTNDSTDKTTAAPILDSPIEFVTDEKGNFVSFPMQSAQIGGSNGESNSGGLDLNGQDPESIDVSPSIPSSSSQPATEVIEVTNPQGEPVTDAEGNKTTEYVTVAPSESNTGEYKSVTDGNYILWMDISKNEDFIFNDEFVKITFKIKEGIPNGEYPITFVTDFSTIKGVTLNPTKVYNGTITVGGDAKKSEDFSKETEFIVYGDNISCKQGDTVDFYINTKNNPGLAATLLWFYYDSNAMSVTTKGVKAAGEFAEISNRLDSNA